MNLMYISLSLTVGFVIGAVIAYVFVTRFSSKHKIQDELLRSKRELANAKRQLDEFFVGGDELFSQLTKAYSTYARYMEEAAKRLSPDNSDLYRIENSTANGEEVRKSLKESLMALKEQVSDITATIEEEEKKEKGETVSEEESAVKSEKKADRKAEKADESLSPWSLRTAHLRQRARLSLRKRSARKRRCLLPISKKFRSRPRTLSKDANRKRFRLRHRDRKVPLCGAASFWP